ncbi:hypothetical protein [Roseburia intestinalis]
MNLNEIWEKLDERMFAAVHGFLIVNLKHVHSVSSMEYALQTAQSWEDKRVPEGVWKS